MNRAANAFAAHGIGLGDRVAFLTWNLPEQVTGFYGLLKLGAVPVPIEDLPVESANYGTIHYKGLPTIYVVSEEDRDVVEDALRRHGIAYTRTLSKADLELVSKPGRIRATKECGPIRVVRWELREGGRPRFTVRSRGPTGDCPENMIDLTAIELKRQLIHTQRK